MDKAYGAIAGIGAIGILMILTGTSNIFGLSPESCKGFILVGISLLLFIASGATFSLQWILGTAVGVVGLIVFLFGINSFASSTNPAPNSLLPTISHILLL